MPDDGVSGHVGGKYGAGQDISSAHYLFQLIPQLGVSVGRRSVGPALFPVIRQTVQQLLFDIIERFAVIIGPNRHVRHIPGVDPDAQFIHIGKGSYFPFHIEPFVPFLRQGIAVKVRTIHQSPGHIKGQML